MNSVHMATVLTPPPLGGGALDDVDALVFPAAGGESWEMSHSCPSFHSVHIEEFNVETEEIQQVSVEK